MTDITEMNEKTNEVYILLEMRNTQGLQLWYELFGLSMNNKMDEFPPHTKQHLSKIEEDLRNIFFGSNEEKPEQLEMPLPEPEPEPTPEPEPEVQEEPKKVIQDPWVTKEVKINKTYILEHLNSPNSKRFATDRATGIRFYKNSGILEKNGITSKFLSTIFRWENEKLTRKHNQSNLTLLANTSYNYEHRMYRIYVTKPRLMAPYWEVVTMLIQGKIPQYVSFVDGNPNNASIENIVAYDSNLNEIYWPPNTVSMPKTYRKDAQHTSH